MKRSTIVIIVVCIILLFGLIYYLNSKAPRRFTWNPTYSQHDKQPFGAYAFDQILVASWPDEYLHSYKSISQLLSDEEMTDQNLLIVTQNFNSGKKEIQKMLDYVAEGHQVMIVADFFEPFLADTLRFENNYSFSFTDYIRTDIRNENTKIYFCGDSKNTTYTFPSSNVTSSFVTWDTLHASVVAVDTAKHPVMLRYPWGKGNVLLACNPLTFTNYSILDNKSNGFIEHALGYLKGASLIRTENYHAKTDKGTSPLRYLLNNPPLQWALYITIITILLFMIFTAKRKQKAIPVIKDPENRLPGFIRSIASLYLKRNDNADIVYKKYVYWADSLKREYGLDIINRAHDAEYCSEVAIKTGQSVSTIKDLFARLDRIQGGHSPTDNEMIDLITKMDKIK